MGGRDVSEQKMLLMLVLERGDPAGLVRISSGEMNEGALAGGGASALGWRVGAGKMGSEVGLIAQPACPPAVGGGDGEGEISKVPNPVESLTMGRGINQCEKLCGSDAGMGDEVAPEDGKRAAATEVVAAIGTKKRMRLISRSWPCD